MNKLYLAYMGGVSKERLMEDHEIIMIVAKSLEEAKSKAKEKTKLTNDIHIDMILEVNNIDGYDILLKKGGKENIEKVSNYSEL